MQETINRKRNKSTYFLMVFFLLIPFEYPLASLGAGSILRYVGILTMGVACIDFVNNNNAMIQLNYRTTIIFVWIIYAYFSTLWCIDAKDFSRYYSMYFNNALMFIIVSLVRYDKVEAEKIKKAYILGVVFLILYMTFVPGAVTYSEFDNRLTLATASGEELIDQNYLAAIILLPYGIVFYKLVNQKNNIYLKFLQIIFCSACVYYIFVTGSRSGLIAISVVSIMNVWKGIKNNILIVFIVMMLAFIAIPKITQLLPEDLQDRYSVEAMTGSTEGSDDRLKIWKVAIKEINNRRIICGYGAGSSQQVIENGSNKRFAIHNAWLAMVVELGIIGLVMFVAWIYVMVKDLIYYKYTDVLLSFLGILIESMFLDVMTTKFFWGAMILLTVMIASGKKEEKLIEKSNI